MLMRPGLVIACILSSLGGCSAQVEESAPTSEDAIIGGVEVQSPTLDAVGALKITYRGEERSCTGTLIAPDRVLTAKHCAIAMRAKHAPDGRDHLFLDEGSVSFAIGSDIQDARLVPIVHVELATPSEGGVGYGADLAIYHLGERVDDVVPLPVAREPLIATDVGRSFVAIGYGIRNQLGWSGHRTLGHVTLRLLEGNPYEAAFGSFDGYRTYLERSTGPWPPELAAERKAFFDSQRLLTGYEAYTSSEDGAQPCNGDSGGPLLRKLDGKITVFGVASWALSREHGLLCSKGLVYARIAPSIHAGLGDREQPCSGESERGRCDGATAIRCTTLDEGRPRVVRTHCAELDLACGMMDGNVGCVAPPAR